MSNERNMLLASFADYLILEKGVSENSRLAYCSDINRFTEYLCANRISLTGFTSDDLRAYFESRFSEGVTGQSILRFYSSINCFVRFERLEGLREDDPMIELERPKSRRDLPKVMSEETVVAFLEAPDLGCHTGLRDRAMFELLYATGMRVSELCNLKFEDMHLSERYMLIKGKGDRQRVIPITDAACYWVEKYLSLRRPEKDPDSLSPFVFLSNKSPDGAKPMTRIAFWYRVKSYASQIGISSSPSPHTFRHAFATHMLNHDADLRSLQMMLGHSSLTTTQIYTHVALARMHEVYDKTHPKA